MDTTWFRNFFSRAQRFDVGATTAKADQGDAEAQFALGFKCGAAEGAGQDLTQAAGWYRKAAEQNHSLAQFNLGLMYAKGEGVPQDAAESVMWIRRAAHQGDAGAQFHLGIKYHSASVWGLQPDTQASKIEAYKWLQLAAAQGYKGSSEAWERVTIGMTHEEVTAGKQGAAEFVAGKPVVVNV